MQLAPPPRSAAWRHISARDGFEVTFCESTPDGWRLRGETSAVEQGAAWAVAYAIETGGEWRTRRVEVRLRGVAGDSALLLEQPGDGRWLVDGRPEPLLDGCVDVDLESSVVTNTLPVHRLDLADGFLRAAPAAFVRAHDLRVERLEQTYQLLAPTSEGLMVAYTSPTFDVACTLRYDAAGLVLDYPGLAVRHS